MTTNSLQTGEGDAQTTVTKIACARHPDDESRIITKRRRAAIGESF
jgi:hypothetical protein